MIYSKVNIKSIRFKFENKIYLIKSQSKNVANTNLDNYNLDKI